MRTLCAYSLFIVLILCWRCEANSGEWRESLRIADSLAASLDFESAIEVGELTLRQAEKELGESDTAVARVLNRLARYYESILMYDHAEELLIRSTEILERVQGPDHINVAVTLNNRASILVERAKYSQAEPIFKRVVSILTDTLGPDHHLVTMAENNLATVYKRQGRFTEAEAIYRRVLARAIDKQLPQISMYLRNIGTLYWDQGDYETAETYLVQSVIWNEMCYGDDHWVRGSDLGMLANFYREQGRYTEAERLLIWMTALQSGKDARSDYFAGSFCHQDWADLYADMGRYAEADSHYTQALSISEKARGKDEMVGVVLDKFSRLRRLQERPMEALGFAERACRIRLDRLYDNVLVSSERDALVFSQDTRGSVNGLLSCYLDLESDGRAHATRVTDIVCRSKGLISDGVFERQLGVLRSTDPELGDLVREFKSVKSAQSRLFVQSTGADSEAYRSKIDSLEQVATTVEVELSRRSAGFRQHASTVTVCADSLKLLLGRGEVLVEYLRYDYYQLNPDSAIPKYLAVVLARDSDPELIDLGGAEEIDLLVRQYREHIAFISATGSVATAEDLKEYLEVARAIYTHVWQPIEEYISGKDLVLISPDGELSSVSFAGLRDARDRYLVERVAIHYLSAGRDLVRYKHREDAGSGLLALGDPDYDASVADRVSEVSVASHSVPGPRSGVLRNVRSGCRKLDEFNLPPLPATRSEIENITTHWLSVSDESAVAYLGREATEDVFKSSAPGKRVIHIATHGYHLSDDCVAEMSDYKPESEARWMNENPLLHTGLFLAGANLHGSGADSASVEDGVLTAYEVTALDLSGVELVVLSACETGLGTIQAGEDVYGLRRAFQMAGAETVVSSLWSVADQTTAEFLTQLYEGREGSLPETIRQLQLQKIRELRELGGVDHPVSWSAFVAYGRWR